MTLSGQVVSDPEHREQVRIAVEERLEVIVDTVESVVEHLSRRLAYVGPGLRRPEVQLARYGVRAEPGLDPHFGRGPVYGVGQPPCLWSQRRIQRAVVVERTSVYVQVPDAGPAQLLGETVYIGLTLPTVDPGVPEPFRVMPRAVGARGRRTSEFCRESESACAHHLGESGDEGGYA